LCGVYFCTLCPSIGPTERSRQDLDRLPLVTDFLTNFWVEHIDGARLSPNSVRNAVWHALNEPVCQYLRTRNPRSSTVYIYSLGPLARDSPCICHLSVTTYMTLSPAIIHRGSSFSTNQASDSLEHKFSFPTFLLGTGIPQFM